VFASQNEAATARVCDLLTILIGDITFDITQVLPSTHYVGFGTQSRLPDRSKEVDAQRCGPERFERREGGSKSEFIARRFPQKKTKRVSNGLAGQGTIRAFLRGLNFVFQKGQSKGLNAVYHFTFTGQEEVKATITIRDEKLQVSEGHNGQADLRLTADRQTWLRFLRKEANLVWALLRRKIRIQGPPKLLLAFGRCFPS
jgi:SCP-2 sterol transfer family